MSAALKPDQILRMHAPDFTCDLDLLDDEVWKLLDVTSELKRSPSRYAQALSGKSIALLFEKPSLRTRLTFELAAKQLGGDSVGSDGIIGAREPLKDIARNLDRWVNAIVARTFSQNTVEELARWSSVPVINALSDLYHPCQALADVFTILEMFGEFRGRTVAFVGDGNNVAHSLMLTSTRLGLNFRIATPQGYGPNRDVCSRAQSAAFMTGARLEVLDDPADAVRGADVVYTDVWASMGQEDESEERCKVFHDYQVNGSLMSLAGPDAIFLHCLPAKRGQEVTDNVLESPQSRVFDQAENRLHTQKALLLMLLG
jgi:ornithine carbamoyltransferase